MIKNENENKFDPKYVTRNIVMLIALFLSTGMSLLYLTLVPLEYGSVIQAFGLQWIIIGIVLFLNKNK